MRWPCKYGAVDHNVGTAAGARDIGQRNTDAAPALVRLGGRWVRVGGLGARGEKLVGSFLCF